MWWWVLAGLIFLALLLGLILPDIVRRERWNRRVPARKRRKAEERADTSVLSKTKNPAAYASSWRYRHGLWPFGIRRRPDWHGVFPGDPLDGSLPDEEPPPGL